MKRILFAQNVSKEVNSDNVYESLFLTRTISEEDQNELNKINDSRASIFKLHTRLGLLFIVVGFVSLLIDLILVAITQYDVITSEKTMNTLVTFVILFAVIIVLSVIGFIVVVFLVKKRAQQDDVKELDTLFSTIMTRVVEDFDITNGRNIDILLSKYNEKENKTKYKNYAVKDTVIWSKVDEIHVFMDHQVFTFNTSSIIDVYEESRKVKFTTWNKQVRYNKGEYKEYKIKYKNNEYIIKDVIVLVILVDDIEYELQVPGYEMKIISEMFGRTVRSV